MLIQIVDTFHRPTHQTRQIQTKDTATTQESPVDDKVWGGKKYTHSHPRQDCNRGKDLIFYLYPHNIASSICNFEPKYDQKNAKQFIVTLGSHASGHWLQSYDPFIITSGCNRDYISR